MGLFLFESSRDYILAFMFYKIFKIEQLLERQDVYAQPFLPLLLSLSPTVRPKQVPGTHSGSLLWVAGTQGLSLHLLPPVVCMHQQKVGIGSGAGAWTMALQNTGCECPN